MEKRCTQCKLIKDGNEFYTCKKAKDGKQSSCKLCMKMAQVNRNTKRPKIEIPAGYKKTNTSESLNLLGLKKEDYCEMYSAMVKLGFNPELDIHIQFCEKWGLKVSKSPRKGKPNKFTYQDCK